MSTKDSTDALKLSLVPAVLASSCCLTVPALALLGISFGENFFYEYRMWLRLLAVIVLLLSLVLFFYKRGVTNKDEYLIHKKSILLISLQTLVFAVAFYAIFLYMIVPAICTITATGSCTI